MENAEESETVQVTQKRKLDNNILKSFENLTKPEESLRIKGIVNLIKHLTNRSNSEKENEVNYALGRIIRGLGGSTSSARAGFYTALTCLINSDETVTVSNILKCIGKHLHAGGSCNKGENADVTTGQILACGSIIRSELWAKSTDEERNTILDMLLKASKERVYLALPAYTFVLEGLNKLNTKDVKKIMSPVVQEVSKTLSEYSLDSLFLLYGLKVKMPHIVRKCIGSDEIIAAENAENISNILMRIPRITVINHPVYASISKDIAGTNALATWVQALDKQVEQLNRNKQMIITTIYSMILRNIKNFTAIPDILTDNFMKNNLYYLKNCKLKGDPEFKKKIDEFLLALLEAVKQEGVDDSTKQSVLSKILFSPGVLIFEKITGSKIVQQITSTLSSEGVKKLAVMYRQVIDAQDNTDQEKAWLNNDRLYAAHLLIKLINHPNAKDENEWKIEQLTYFMELALLKENSYSVNLGLELSAAMKKAFFGALDLKLAKLDDLKMILSSLVHRLHLKITSNDDLHNPLSEEALDIWNKLVHLVNRIDKKSDKDGLKTVFLILFLHMGLQLFNESRLAVDSLNELFLCYDKAKTVKRSTRNNAGDDLPWIDVVIDLFLNLLSRNSHLLRTIIKTVFPHLCEYVSVGTMHQILSVLDPKNKDVLLSKYSEGSSDEDSDTDAKDEEESEHEDDSNESNMEDDNIDEGNNDKLRMALQKVLHSTGGQSDEESVDLDEMSDTEAEKLDKELSGVFRQFKPNHGNPKKLTKMQEMLAHFKIRVLDLIDIYLDANPSMMIALEIMLPLLQAFEFSVKEEYQKPLQDRLKFCLKKLTKLKKFSNVDGVDHNTLSELLESMLQKGSKNAWIVQDMAVQMADCTIFVIRCAELLSSSEKTPKKIRVGLKKTVSGVVTAELHKYFHQRDCITPYIFFKNLMQMNWNGLLTLAPLLLEYSFDEDIKIHKKKQVLELLRLFYSNQRYLSTNVECIEQTLEEHHHRFSNNLLNYFKGLVIGEGTDNVKDIFLCAIFSLLISMKSCCLNIENIDWEGIVEQIKEYRKYKSLSKDARSAFNKLCNRFGVSPNVEMKTKGVQKNVQIENTEESVENPKKKLKRKSKNSEKLKLCKEAKKLRLESLSSGFEQVNFTDVNMDSIESEVKKSIEDCSLNMKQDSSRVPAESSDEAVTKDASKRKSRKKLKYNNVQG